jgi:hypothetical protein
MGKIDLILTCPFLEETHLPKLQCKRKKTLLMHEKWFARTIVQTSQLSMTLSQHSTTTTLRLPIVVGSRVEVEAKAQATATTFKVEKFYELPPFPTIVEMTRLYVLLSEFDIVMSKQVLEEVKQCMLCLMKMEIEGILCNNLVITFREWFLYPLVNIFPPYCSNFWPSLHHVLLLNLSLQWSYQLLIVIM